MLVQCTLYYLVKFVIVCSNLFCNAPILLEIARADNAPFKSDTELDALVKVASVIELIP